jgi:hypothetical protein
MRQALLKPSLLRVISRGTQALPPAMAYSEALGRAAASASAIPEEKAM